LVSDNTLIIDAEDADIVVAEMLGSEASTWKNLVSFFSVKYESFMLLSILSC
jgi:hypothetical protein